MNQNEVLRHIASNTHCLFTVEFVDVVNKAFGTKIKPWTYKANPKDPKGLILDSGAKQAQGMASFDLAQMLCGELGVKFEEKLGRGSQVHACVEALRAAGYGKELTEQTAAAT